MTVPVREWQGTELGDLESPVLEALASIAIRRELPPGTLLTEEAQQVSSVTLLAKGSAEVRKRERLNRGREHLVGRVAGGEVVGELSLLDRQPAPTTVRTTEPCIAYSFPFAAIDASPLSNRLLQQFSRLASQRLRRQVDESLATAQRRTAVGDFLVNVLYLLCGYTLVLGALPAFSAQLPWDVALLSFPLQIVFGVGAWRFIRATGYPLRDFGIGFRHLLGSLWESLVFTAALLALVTGIKWVLLMVTPALAGARLIEHPDIAARLGDPHVQTWLVIYGFSCLVQELIVRGALQSSLEMFLVGRGRVRRAVVVSALIFAVNHLHLSFVFALAAFIPGLFWGWLFARRRNLVGPTLSHVLVGSYVFFILGAPLGT